MTTKNYLIIEGNVVTNLVIWDGDTTNWQPPEGSIYLVAEEVLTRFWQLDYEATPMDWVLKEETGKGQIGDIWDGSVLTTPDEKPPMPEGQIIDLLPGMVKVKPIP